MQLTLARCFMNEIIFEWITKAEEDWQVVCLLSGSDLQAYNTICFHAQQCAEKLLKALLINHQIVPEYTHNLVRLRQKLSAYYSEWDVTLDELELLSVASVEYRYPGEEASPEDVEICIDVCDRLRNQILAILQVEN
jgi:HEPN domain-containing protein